AWYSGGQNVTVPAPLDRLPVFVRANAVIPATDTDDVTLRTEEPSRALLLFPAAADARRSSCWNLWVEDDGATHAWKQGGLAWMECTFDARPGAIHLMIEKDGSFA